MTNNSSKAERIVNDLVLGARQNKIVKIAYKVRAGVNNASFSFYEAQPIAFIKQEDGMYIRFWDTDYKGYTELLVCNIVASTITDIDWKEDLDHSMDGMPVVV